jgi:hypothetical protein
MTVPSGSKVLLVAVTLCGDRVWASPKVDPVVVIRDQGYLRHALEHLGPAFVANRNDANAARADLARYMWAKMKTAKSLAESARWRQVLLKRPAYIWHCGGYTTQGSRFVYCTLSRYQDAFQAERFPVVFDGGTDYCRAHYSLKARRLVAVECNGDT